MLRNFVGAGVFGLVVLLSNLANAAGVDFTSLTSAVDFSSVITAVLLVFAAIAGVGVAFKGGKMILKALGMS
jgi:hypothetical protein